MAASNSTVQPEYVQGDIPVNENYIENIEEIKKQAENPRIDEIKVKFPKYLSHPEHKPKRCMTGTSVFVFWEDRSNLKEKDEEKRWFVLLGIRKGSHGAGTLALPGGHIERCEYFEKTARREVAEETGLQITDVRRMVATDDVMYEVERGPDDKPKEGPIYKDIKHYETNFLGALLLGETERPNPIIMERKKCYGWMWVRCDHVKRMFEMSEYGKELREWEGKPNDRPTEYAADDEWDKLANSELFKAHMTKNGAPELFLPLTNLWLQNGSDFRIYECYKQSVPEAKVFRPAGERRRIDLYKGIAVENETMEEKGEHRQFMEKVYTAQLKELCGLLMTLKQESKEFGLDSDKIWAEEEASLKKKMQEAEAKKTETN